MALEQPSAHGVSNLDNDDDEQAEAFFTDVKSCLENLKLPGAPPSTSFPSSLTPSQRKFIHLLALQMGFTSASHGHGNFRVLTVYRDQAAKSNDPANKGQKANLRTGAHARPETSEDKAEEMGRDERVSRMLAALLRHRAEAERLALTPDGFAEARQIVNLSNFQRLGVTELEIERLVMVGDQKKRFALKRRTEDGVLLIRACQGHTIKSGKDDGLLVRILHPEAVGVCVHGTYMVNWLSIRASGGVSRMNRNHIHFAPRLPNGDGDVISGVREDCEVVMHLNVASVLAAGLELFRSANGVLLSPGDARGIISLEFFENVVRLRDGAILWPPVSPITKFEESDNQNDAKGQIVEILSAQNSKCSGSVGLKSPNGDKEEHSDDSDDEKVLLSGPLLI